MGPQPSGRLIFSPPLLFPGRSPALDVCVASASAAAARGDVAQASFDRKLSTCKNEIPDVRDQGIHYRPLVWTADGRPHPAACTAQYAAERAADVGDNASAQMENTKFKLLFFAGERPLHGQFCRTRRHGAECLLARIIDRASITGAMSFLMTVELATTTAQMTTMTSPPSPVNCPHLCSHHASHRLVLPSRGSLLLLCDDVSRFVSQHVSRVPASPGDLELDVLFEDEVFALEWATHRRCFPAQPGLSALQRYTRRKCDHLLRDLAATVDLPPHSLPPASGPGSLVVRKGRQRHPHLRRKINSALADLSNPLAHWPIC